MPGMQNIEGNMLIDILAGIVAYPLTVVQIHDEAEAAAEDSDMRTSDEEPQANGGGQGKVPAIV